MSLSSGPKTSDSGLSLSRVKHIKQLDMISDGCGTVQQAVRAATSMTMTMTGSRSKNSSRALGSRTLIPDKKGNNNGNGNGNRGGVSLFSTAAAAATATATVHFDDDANTGIRNNVGYERERDREREREEVIESARVWQRDVSMKMSRTVGEGGGKELRGLSEGEGEREREGEGEHIELESVRVRDAYRVLLSSIESGTWTDLNQPIDDIFTHAAFLVIPHTPHTNSCIHTPHTPHTQSDSHLHTHIHKHTQPGDQKDIPLTLSSVNVKEISPRNVLHGTFFQYNSEEYSQLAFLSHTMDVKSVLIVEKKRDFVRKRFREALIEATPCILRLKSTGIITVFDMMKMKGEEWKMLCESLHVNVVYERQVKALLYVAVGLASGSKVHHIETDPTHCLGDEHFFSGIIFIIFIIL